MIIYYCVTTRHSESWFRFRAPLQPAPEFKPPMPDLVVVMAQVVGAGVGEPDVATPMLAEPTLFCGRLDIADAEAPPQANCQTRRCRGRYCRSRHGVPTYCPTLG